jgi:hypothetical protein
MRHLCLSASALAIVALVATSCGQSTGSKITAPSGGTTKITGSIVASAGSVPISSSGATVSIVGTDLFTTIGGDQTFTLPNVPANTNVVLQFTGTGLNSQANLGLIQFADNVVLVLFRTNSTLILSGINGIVPPATASTTIAGQVASISTTDRSFIVLGQTILVDPVTQFLRPDGTLGSFFDLFVGLPVQVTIIPAQSGAVTARVVQIANTSAGLTVILQGPIASLTGTAQSFSFVVQGQTVRGDSTTVFENGMSFSALANGVNVQVTGIMRNGFVQATRIRTP